MRPGWELRRAKYLFREVKERGYDLPLASVTKTGGVEFRSDLDISVWNPGDDTTMYKRVRPGDFVIGLRSFQSGLGYSSIEGLVSPAYTVLRPRMALVGSYYRHYFKSSPLISQLENVAQGIRQGRTISTEDFNNLLIPVPPDEQQREIGALLDREIAEMDAVEAQLKRVQALLTERSASAVAASVLGIESPGDRQDSVLGPLPAHWRVGPLKRFWSVIDCKHITPDYVPEGVPYISPGDIQPGRLDPTQATRFVSQADLTKLADGPRRVRRGDIIYSRNASVGTAAYVDTDVPVCMGQDVCKITSTTSDQIYLTYVLNSVARRELDAVQIGSTFTRVNVAQILNLTVPCPPVAEQRAIAAQLDAMVQDYRSAVDAIEKQRRLLGERRQVLITEAVTGQLEIPGVAA